MSDGPCVITPSATWRIESRRSMAVFWIQRKASGSLRSSCPGGCSWPGRRLAGLQPLGQVGHLGLEQLQLGEAAQRHLDRGHQVVLGERLDQVGHGAASRARSTRSRWLNAVRMTTGAIRCGGDPLRGGDAVELGHLDVEHDQVGTELLGELDGRSPSPACPTTSYPSSASISARSRRIRASSSAMTTRRAWVLAVRSRRPGYPRACVTPPARLTPVRTAIRKRARRASAERVYAVFSNTLPQGHCSNPTRAAGRPGRRPGRSLP